jgi:hypothetical protein
MLQRLVRAQSQARGSSTGSAAGLVQTTSYLYYECIRFEQLNNLGMAFGSDAVSKGMLKQKHPENPRHDPGPPLTNFPSPLANFVSGECILGGGYILLRDTRAKEGRLPTFSSRCWRRHNKPSEPPVICRQRCDSGARQWSGRFPTGEASQVARRQLRRPNDPCTDGDSASRFVSTPRC